MDYYKPDSTELDKVWGEKITDIQYTIPLMNLSKNVPLYSDELKALRPLYAEALKHALNDVKVEKGLEEEDISSLLSLDVEPITEIGQNIQTCR